jgi:hypothetical protein
MNSVHVLFTLWMAKRAARPDPTRARLGHGTTGPSMPGPFT